MSDNYSNAVDMWALGCLVHELLTGHIPFREVEYEEDGTTEFDLGSGEVLEPQTDMYAVNSFCDGKTELPTDVLRQCLVSETAIEFLKVILVADPGSRAAAKEALESIWLVREEEPEKESFPEEELENEISLNNHSFNTRRRDSLLSIPSADSVINQDFPRPRTPDRGIPIKK